MNVETGGLIGRYAAWLLRGSTERDLDSGWKELSFPFLDRHNDYLQVFVREDQDSLHITDDGRTIRDLRQAGYDLMAVTRRRRIAERILRGHGLDPGLLDKGELAVNAVNGEFPDKLQSLLLSMLAIDALAGTSPLNVAAMFKEDIEEWLRGIGARFEKGAHFQGKSGEGHDFDFVIPGAGRDPAKVLHAITNPDRTHVQSFTYEVMDTRAALNGDSPAFFAVLKDASVGKKQYLALLSQDIKPVRWGDRDYFAAKLT